MATLDLTQNQVNVLFPDTQLRQLADVIHYAKCHYNHTDGCGYGYRDWDRPEQWNDMDLACKQRAYEAAKALRPGVGGIAAVEVFLRVHEGIRGMEVRI